MPTVTTEMRAVPMAEAMRLLDVSRRTVLRRLANGTLQGEKRKGKWLVYVPARPTEGQRAQPDQTRSDIPAQLSQLAQERDTLAQRVSQLEEERDFLRRMLENEQQAHARTQALAMSQRLLPAPAQAGPSWWARLTKWLTGQSQPPKT